LWHNLLCCPNIWLEGLRKTTEIFNQNRWCTAEILRQSHTKYKWGALPVELAFLVYQMLKLNFPVFNFVTDYRIFTSFKCLLDCLCGLVVRVSGYRSRGPGIDSRRYQIFWEVVVLKRGPLSLVRIIEELLEWKSSGSGLENWD
jgi:hypothetical protein